MVLAKRSVFFRKISQMPGDGLRACAQGDAALKIASGINLVRNLASVAVEVVLAGPPAGGIPLRDDAMHAIRRKEAVVNALLEAVLIDRVAEIQVGVAVVLALRCSSHAELVGRLEIFEDFAPVGIVLGAAAMAFVHNNQVKEIRSELFVT
jgi:hypothetical protein